MVYKYGHTFQPSINDYYWSEPPIPTYYSIRWVLHMLWNFIPITTDIQSLPTPPTKDTTTETSNKTLHKKSVEPLYILTLNIVHKEATNIPSVPPSSTPAPCKNRTQFESLNFHRIFWYHQFWNQKYLTAETNTSLINSGLLLSNIGSFATISNPPKGKPINNRRWYLDKAHMKIVFGDPFTYSL